MPEGPRDDAPARARLAYDELLSHQLTLALARARKLDLLPSPTVVETARRHLSERYVALSHTDDELKVLSETGCYADFTYPSAPHEARRFESPGR